MKTTIIIIVGIIWLVFAICAMVMCLMFMYEVTYTNRMARKVKRAKLKEYMKSRKK